MKQVNTPFSLSFTVQFTGADYITVQVEEDFSTTLRDYRFYGPDIARVQTGNITSLYSSWITIIVMNQYATVSEILEYDPTTRTISHNNSILADSPALSAPTSIESIEFFDMKGARVFKGSPQTFINSNFPKGIYIKKENRLKEKCQDLKANSQIKTVIRIQNGLRAFASELSHVSLV